MEDREGDTTMKGTTAMEAASTAEISPLPLQEKKRPRSVALEDKSSPENHKVISALSFEESDRTQ
jgi:hypothetical protein